MNHKLFFFACALNLFYYVSNLLASPVIGGEEDNNNDHKYHVNIYKHFDPPRTAFQVCGGAIISNYHVLTTAYFCFMIKENGRIMQEFHPRTKRMVVTAGTRVTGALRFVLPIQKVYIPRVFNHNGEDTYADIAVAKVEGSFYLAENAYILHRLLFDTEPHLEVYDNQYAVVAGNGCNGYSIMNERMIVEDQTKVPENRQVLRLLILQRNHCQVYDHSICAASDNREIIRTCAYGDYGSPLVYGDTIIGVLSTAPLNYHSQPLVMKFTRVAKFHGFITKAMDESGDHREMYVWDD